MEKEKTKIAYLMDTRKEDNIIQGINILWNDLKERKLAGKNAKLDHWFPTV